MATTTCRGCGNDIDPVRRAAERTLCGTCAVQLGLVNGGEPARPDVPCPRCNHTEFIRAQMRELTTSPERYSVREAVPMAVTYTPRIYPGGSLMGVEPSSPYGILEMYVCIKCGFTEWYCRNPHEIPIAEEYGTEKVDVGRETPYR
jgi:hypothetical protein